MVLPSREADGHPDDVLEGASPGSPRSIVNPDGGCRAEQTRTSGSLPLPLGRAFPIFVAIAILITLLIGHAALTWGVVAKATSHPATTYEMNALLWMPFAIQESNIITVDGGRGPADPRLTKPVLMVETVIYWIAIGLAGSWCVTWTGGLIAILARSQFAVSALTHRSVRRRGTSGARHMHLGRRRPP